MILVDTNIFLEILLEQDKKEDCKKFLETNATKLTITDFSLHSIGVILFKYHKEDIFQEFVEDIMPNVSLVSLPIDLYEEIIAARKELNLDFDDAYQYITAKYHNLQVATMDKDFEKIENVEILFL